MCGCPRTMPHRRKQAIAWLAGLSLAILAMPFSASAQDADAGKAQFIKSCGVCHAVEKGAAPRQGPNLLGIVGRKAASVEGFKYSEAMKTADWVWDEKNLDPWIENAAAMKAGTVMSYKQADPEKRTLIIGYLKTLSAQ
jgi:cytochrome c